MRWKLWLGRKRAAHLCAATVLLVGMLLAYSAWREMSTSVTPSPLASAYQQAHALISTPPNSPLLAFPQVYPGDWPDFLLGTGGFNDSEAEITPSTVSRLLLAWTAHAAGGISSEPVVVDGTVYWGSWDGYEHANNAATGQMLWSIYLGRKSSPQCYPTTAGVASTATLLSVSIKGKTRLVDFVGGGNAHVYALDAVSGRVLWSTSLDWAPGTFIWGSPVLFRGHLYIGTASVGMCPATQGHFFQLSAVTGTIERYLDLVPQGCAGGGVWSSPTLDAAADDLYITTSNDVSCAADEPYAMSMIELRASTLTILGSWQVPEAWAAYDGDFGSTPVLFTAQVQGAKRAMVGAVNKNGIFYAFERGKISAGPLWQARLSTPLALGGCSKCPTGDEAAVAWDGSHLYAGSSSTDIAGRFCYGSVRALDPSSGAFLWQSCLSIAYRVMAPPIVIPGLVIAAAGPDFFALDASTGSRRFAYHDPSPNAIFVGAATVAHGSLYIGDLDGTLLAFRLAGSSVQSHARH